MTTEATTPDEILGEGGVRAFERVKEERKELRRELSALKEQLETDTRLGATRPLRHEIADLNQQLTIVKLERDMWVQRAKNNGESARRLRLELDDIQDA